MFKPGGPGADGVTLGWTIIRQLASLETRGCGRWWTAMTWLVSPQRHGQHEPIAVRYGRALGDLGADETAELEHMPDVEEASAQQAKQRQVQLQVEACMDNPLRRHVHTEGAARDMDLLRAVRGEDKLNLAGLHHKRFAACT